MENLLLKVVGLKQKPLDPESDGLSIIDSTTIIQLMTFEALDMM